MDGGGGVLKPLSALATIVPLLFGFFSCSNASSSWEEPVYDYFDKYTNTAAIEKQEIGSQTLKDSSGTTCIPSGDDKTVTFYLRNPRKYDLDLGIDLIDAPILLEQDAEDKTVVRITYPQSFLLENEGGGSIGGTITLREHETQRSFESYSFSLRCNSAPPAINNGAVMLRENTYYLCLNIPVSDIHKDLKKLIIDDGNTKQTVEFDVDDSCNIQLPNPCILTTTNPGSLDPLPDGATFSPGTRNNLYYNSGIIANPNKVQTFKITLVDQGGLSSSTVISTASKQVKAPTLNDNVSNAVLSSSGTTTLALDENSNAQIKIIKPTQATNGDPISSAQINYELKKDGTVVSLAPTNSNGNKILTLENTGTYTLEVWATAAGYLTSETKTYTINVPPLKVRFYANGGSLVSGGVNPQEIPKNETTQLTQASNVVTKTGYEFTGWASSADGAKIYDDAENVTLQSSTNLYALWQAKTYTVSFNLNGATGNAPGDINITYDSTYGSQLPTSSPSRYGYTFSGWYTAQTGGSKVTSSTTYQTASSSTLYAHWTAKTCTVTFNANYTGSTYSQTKTETFGSNYTLPTSPTRTGYTFAGWYKESACTNEATTVANASDHTLYAKWQAKTYTVKFNLNYTGAGTAPSNITVTYDGTYSNLPSDPTRTGYTFDGWFTAATGGSKVTTATTVLITSTQTLYAHWTLNYYAYTCSPTNGSLKIITATINMDSGKIAYGAKVTMKFEGNTGYGLSSVTVKETGGSRKLNTGDITITENGGTQVYVKFTMPDYPVTITPTFRKAYKVKITPYSCTYNGITEYVKEKCKNKPVRIWIADAAQGGAFGDEYKEVTLDENAEYDGYILYPNGVNNLSSNALLCALSVYQVDNSTGNHGFCYGTVSSSTTNLTMAILQPRTAAPQTLIAYVYPFESTSSPYIFSAIPNNIGFLYKWNIYNYDSSDNRTLAAESSWYNINQYSVPTDKLVTGKNGLESFIKVADISIPSNGTQTFQYNPNP